MVAPKVCPPSASVRPHCSVVSARQVGAVEGHRFSVLFYPDLPNSVLNGFEVAPSHVKLGSLGHVQRGSYLPIALLLACGPRTSISSAEGLELMSVAFPS